MALIKGKEYEVDVPPHTAREKIGKSTYIYLKTRYYRNSDKKSRTDRTAIGKLNPETDKLIPNENYFKVYHLPFPGAPDFVRNVGLYNLVKIIAENTGLFKLLKKNFPNHYSDILTAAHYFLCDNKAMVYLNDWLDENVSYRKDAFHSTQVSDFLRELGELNKSVFFRDWLKEQNTNEYIAYDVSSISTYSKSIENAEWGYNRDKESLPQINYAMYYGQDSGLPFYYRVYPGSITDKVHLKFMMEDLKELDHRTGYYVMDRGFYMEDNLKYLTDMGFKFLIAMPSDLKIFRSTIDEHRNEIIDCAESYIKNKSLYGKSYISSPYGFRFRMNVFYDESKKPNDVASFYRHLDDLESALTKMDSVPGPKTDFVKYFNITKEDNKLVFERNYTNINKQLSYCGFFILADTVFDNTAEDMLEVYRRRDVIEKEFDDLKNETGLGRLRVHSSQTADGKLFVAFISLILRSAMMNHLAEYMEKKCVSFHKIILELNKIKAIYSHKNKNGFRIMNPLTKTQKEILASFGLDAEEFISSCVV